jgi:hypothetical protein
MLALLLLVLIILVLYAPNFDFKFRIGNKEFEIISSEVSSSETSD